MPKPKQAKETYEFWRGHRPVFGWSPTHTSSYDVARLLAFIEWRGDRGQRDNLEGYFRRCPCCFSTEQDGHKSDCLLYKVLRDSWKEHPGRLDQLWLEVTK